MSRSIMLTTTALAALLASALCAAAQPAETTESIEVTAQQLSAARAGIQTQLGASTYTVTAADIEAQPGATIRCSIR